jgi:hypothetical protein
MLDIDVLSYFDTIDWRLLLISDLGGDHDG